ncbi:MAG TPA: NAD(P)-binding domain-containing protein [Polyangiaceae bacterium]
MLTSPSPTPPKTCIIGAGSSGLVAAKALADAGVPFDCFEEGDRVGGLWVFGNKNGKSAAYRSLSINTSRDRMQYADFPMPHDYPDYPGHARMAAYFDAYATRFDLFSRIRFGTRVERVERDPAGGFRVGLADGSAEHYGAVVVANGHHWDPAWPDPPIPGEFRGIALHSHAYVDPSTPHDLRGKRVVVVGFGNSAVDIACELARPGGASRVVLATRRGAWVLPKYVGGRPLDQLGLIPLFLPVALRQRLASVLYRLVVGKLEDYGLPRPDHRPGSAHPTVSSDLLPMLREGRVTPKPAPVRFHGDELEFSDGSRESADAVVFATGYKVTFPFFDPAFVEAPRNELLLYFRLFHLDIEHLYFVGLAQPLGAIMPIAEAQSKLLADHLTGRYVLPPRDDVRTRTMAERRAMKRRYVASPRHTMQVDFDDFMKALAKEHDAGRKRAARLARRA